MFNARSLGFFLILTLPAMAVLAILEELLDPSFAVFYLAALFVTAAIGNAMYDYTEGGRR